MRGPSRFMGSVQILASTLAAFALASAVTAQQLHGNRPAPASTAPALQCYAIWPDTGSCPVVPCGARTSFLESFLGFRYTVEVSPVPPVLSGSLEALQCFGERRPNKRLKLTGARK